MVLARRAMGAGDVRLLTANRRQLPRHEGRHARDQLGTEDILSNPCGNGYRQQERRTRQAHEHQLRVSEKLYRTLFQGYPHPIVVYDIGTLRFLTVNDAAVARYGYSREEFLTMTVTDIFLEKDHGRLLDRVGKPLPTISNPESRQHRTKSGELVEVEIAFHDLILEGRPARVMVASTISAPTQ